jgi:asparagine synthase (glutamine-hydrolysing)
MCGIAGILRWGEPLDPDEVAAMTRAVAHRGPDGDGFFARDGVALGHRRLAIIDLDGGRQPMANEDDSVWITFNGEIYNYKELRPHLEARGHRFKTHSDTEVIVHGYEEWGPEVVERLRGMFAFAVADFTARRVLLARDQFGIKPLFYRTGPDFLAFGSELAALRKVNAPAPHGRLEAVEYFLRYRYIPGPETVYDDVFQLPPATWMTVDFAGRRTEPRTYWRLAFDPQPGPTDSEWRERFEAVVTESVKAHLVADVPFGVFLSGGIDSTLVARTMSRLLDRPVTAFAIGFDEERFDELNYAREAAGTLGIDLRAETVTPDVAHLLPDLVAHYGQPFADTSMIPTWYVSRLARAHVPMVLSGDGGDEEFAGYPRYDSWVRDTALAEVRGLLASPRGVAWRVPRILKRLRVSTAREVETWEDWIGLIPAPLRRNLWRPELRPLAGRPCQAFVSAAEEALPFERLSRAQYYDFRNYLPGSILTKVDIASMCHGLEVRPPLIDVRVVEFAATLPAAQRYRRAGRATILKWLPKHALSGEFKPAFVHRPKMGFGIPEERWLRPGTPVRRMLEDLLLPAGAAVHRWFDPETIRDWLRRMDAYGHATGAYLWALLILALWLEQNRDVSFPDA